MGCKGLEVSPVGTPAANPLAPTRTVIHSTNMAVFMFPQTKIMIMNPLHLQDPGGWESLKLVQNYAQMVDDNLLREHEAHSPMDSLKG
jgi:hypothetical protein